MQWLVRSRSLPVLLAAALTAGLVAAPDVPAQDAAPAAVPLPHADPGAPNIFYGAVPPLAQKAPVILFVHGLRGNASDWWIRNDMFMAAYGAGFRTAYVSLSSDNSRNDESIEVNARAVGDLLPKVAAHYGVTKLYVVAHSKGGVDVQAAMLDSRVAGLVKALIMISTPNQGTELADWAFGPGRAIAGQLNLLGPGVESMKTSTMSLFRSVADPILQASGIPIYTMAGDRFSNDPLTAPTGVVLRSLVPGEQNDGFVTIPRTRLSPDFAVDLGKLPTDHYHTLTGTTAFPKVHATIMAHELMLAGFRRVASNGFHEQGGSSSNSWAWTMKWYKGKLYVGTGREELCTTLLANDIQTGTKVYPLAMLDDLCPPVAEYPDRLAAEIWQFTPETEEWRRVFRSPATIPVGVNADGSPRFTARDLGFRGMATFTETDGTEALYVGGVTSGAVFGNFPPYDTIGFPPPRLLRTTDGENWAAVPQAPGTFLGEVGKPQPGGTRKIVSFRGLTPFKGKLFATVGDYRGVGQIVASANPRAGNNAWYLAAPVLEQFPVWNLHVFADQLYVTTGDSFINKDGYGVYKTTAEGAPPYNYVPIITNGAWQANPTFRSTQGLSFMDFRGQLYCGTNRPTELIRINPDDTWDLIVGEPRFTPQGLKRPLSGLGIGFGSWFNGHFWRMGVHDDRLYLGTWDWSIGLTGLSDLDRLFGYQYGFDLYRTDDGIHWAAVSKNGMGDGYNYGGRSFETTPFGLFFGTARQRGGLQVFQGPFEPDTPPAITAPSRLEAESEAVVGRNVVLGWDPVPGAARYRIYRATVRPFNELLTPTTTVTLPGSDTPLTLDDIRDGKLDGLCPGEMGETTLCAAVQSVKAAATPAAPILPMAFPLPWTLVGVTATTTYREPAPTALQSLYFVRAETAAGDLSEPSNFVGGPSKAPAVMPTPPPPVVTGIVSSPPNAAGWYRSDVVVRWDVRTPQSGLLSHAGCEPATVTAEGVTTLACSATNSEGETTRRSLDLRIDRTPPALTATASPPANAFGWQRSDVTVGFAATDGGSGVAAVTPPIVLRTEGAGQAVSGAAIDYAGNSAATRLVVNVDKTPPRAVFRFDADRRDLAVLPADDLSGARSSAVAPGVVASSFWEDDDHDCGDRDGRHDKRHPRATLESYRLEDLAGNALDLTLLRHRRADEVRARIKSVAFGGQTPLPVGNNHLTYEWTLSRNDRLKRLEQDIDFGRGPTALGIHAHYDAVRGTTILRTSPPRQIRTLPGLFLVRAALSGDRLSLLD